MRPYLPLLIIVFACEGCVHSWKASLPELDGELAIEGLDAPVEIIRDHWGVPHIRSETDHDVFFALGFVHAQDRLWQMELNRRIGAGRLAEIFGKRALKADRYLRTVGFRARSADALAALDPEWMWMLEAYCEGVNAYLATDPALPPEFGLLKIEPEPFTPLDGYTWIKLMAQSLGADADFEEFRVSMPEELDATLVEDLLEPFPGGAMIMPPEGDGDGGPQAGAAAPSAGWLDERSSTGGPPAFLRELMPIGEPGLGSNNWVIAGENTTTGAPLLANDPHLGLQIPSVWYLAHLDGDKIHTVGATFPGLPLVVIGHNEHLAWGLTNVGPDVQDLVIERFNANDPHLVMVKGKYQPVGIREEIIQVKGGKAVTLEVRETIHGPVMTEFYPGVGEEVSLRWTALLPEDDTAIAFAKLNLARSVEEGYQALSRFVAPAQNIVLADTQGHIGWVAAGLVPDRGEGEDGNFPVPGWDGKHEWEAWIPYEEMPHSFDPARGWIVTANNRPVGDDYPYFLGDDWSSPYRAQRISDLIVEKMPLSAEDMAAIQADRYSLMAEELMPAFRRATAKNADMEALVDGWDGEMVEDSVAVTIYQAWTNQLPGLLVDDEFGELADQARWRNSTLLHRCIGEGACRWCDDVTTEDKSESCDDVADEALVDGLEFLASHFGDNPSGWRWGDVHVVAFDHQFGSVPIIGKLLNRHVSTGGGPYTANIAPFSFKNPFHTAWGPSYRQVLDPADWDRSTFIHTTGQSGHPASEHYDDFIPRWKGCRTIPMVFSREAVDAVQRHWMLLTPQK